MRVAIVSRSVYPLHRYGGLERHTFDLIRSLLSRDVAVHLIVPAASKDRPSDAAAGDTVFRDSRLKVTFVPYVTFPFAGRKGTTILDRISSYLVFGLRAGRAAARLAADGEVDIVHGMGASVLGYTLRASGKRKVPLVFNPHGMEEFGTSGVPLSTVKHMAYAPLRAAVRRCAGAAQCVIATDRALVEPVLAHLRLSPDVVRVIPNAIEPGECDSAAASGRAETMRRQIGLSPDGVLFVSVGRIEANKGFDVMVRALTRLVAARGPAFEWRWVLVGDGSQRAALEQQIGGSGLGNRAIVLGRVSKDDLHAWYDAATVFVHPTLYEGSSIATLEAMAHRRAVIASRAGGLPDKVVPGVTGWLVPPGDDRALADALTDAAGDPARLLSMGNAGRLLVEQQFSWTKVAEEQLRVYGELLSAGRA